MRWRASIGISLLALLLVSANASSALAQAGSTGGRIGKTDKSVSGDTLSKSRSKGKRPVDTGTSDQSSTTRSQCTNIEGVWNSSAPSSVTENIRQTGCNFLGTVTTAFFKHAVSGKYLGSSSYSITITRTNQYTGCNTVMFGSMKVMSGSQLRWVITGTDGKCDLSINYTEARMWTR